MADDAADTGSEPYSAVDPFASPALRISGEPDAGWQPFPFAGSQPWTPDPEKPVRHYDWQHFNRPAWVYVTITNRGNAPSTGTERLRLYWTSLVTDPTWPQAWNDNVVPDPSGKRICILRGEEITKPRRNAALLDDSARAALVAALVKLDSLFYPDSVSLWDKQDQIHRGTHVHNTPNFLPWHRELTTRFELLLRSYNPLLRLPYWDWTTDPRNSSGFNFFTPEFMGSDQGRCGTPFDRFDANYNCSLARSGYDFDCINTQFCPDQPADFRRPNYVIEREVASGPPLQIDPDSLIAASSEAAPVGDQFLWFWGGYLKNLNYSLETNHRLAHSYLGKTLNCKHTSFQDPFAYLLHSNVDKIWAYWQRQPHALHRLDASAVYGNLSASYYLHESMQPWCGTVSFASPVAPWLPGSNSVQTKNAFDPSVVIPVSYDVAPLTIPVLQPGESVVVAYPWHVPDLMPLTDQGADTLSILLLARIETSGDAPYGMTAPETEDVASNIRNNNNVAARRIAVSLISATTATFSEKSAAVVFPNPASGRFQVRMPHHNPCLLRLYHSSGILMQEARFSHNTILPVSGHPPGNYLLVVQEQTSGICHRVSIMIH